MSDTCESETLPSHRHKHHTSFDILPFQLKILFKWKVTKWIFRFARRPSRQSQWSVDKMVRDLKRIKVWRPHFLDQFNYKFHWKVIKIYCYMKLILPSSVRLGLNLITFQLGIDLCEVWKFWHFSLNSIIYFYFEQLFEGHVFNQKNEWMVPLNTSFIGNSMVDKFSIDSFADWIYLE